MPTIEIEVEARASFNLEDTAPTGAGDAPKGREEGSMTSIET